MRNIDLDKLSIFYDEKNNRYGTKITIESGQPRKSIYGKTKQEVIESVKKLIYQSGNHDYMVSKGISFIDLLRYNFSRRDNAGLIGDAQYSRAERVFKRLEKSKIANINVKDLKEQDYQALLEELSKEYAQSSFDKFHSEISQALEFAYRKKIIDEFPLDKKIKPKCKKTTKSILALTIEEQKILTNYLENITVKEYAYKNASLIQLYMDLRIGETMALSLEDIDLENKQIYIHKTVSVDRNEKPIIKENAKTDAGNRTLPIPDNLLPYIKEQMKLALNHKDHLLFVNRNNAIVTESSANSQLKLRLVKLGIYKEGMSTHSLRHSYATRCIEAGIDPVVLSKLMGHADVSITLRKYVTVFNEFKAKSTKKTDQYYNDLGFFKNKIPKNNDNEPQITKNNKSNIIQFPKKYVVNDYER